jgi:uncharacterized protein (DUF2235 family)
MERGVMSKNIVLLSDGTGNSAASVFKTNVWRLFQVLDLSDPSKQIAFYDDGVGTSSFKLFAILGGVFGFGLKRNVLAIYSFCCRNYQPGDRIYCFGFSRGAFTIRAVAGLIASQGLVKYENNEADLARFAADAYRRYRRRFNGGILRFLGHVGIDLRGVRDFAIRQRRRITRQAVAAPPSVEVESIRFVGVWDTVDAYGGPIQEMTRAIDYWIWPLSMPDHFMSAKIHRACHALALEDERDAFHPVIWDERYVRGAATWEGSEKTDWLFDINYDPRSEASKRADPPPHLRTDLPERDRERLSQVWFTGVHADIGGGYPQNGLAYVAFDWMLDRAQAYGLRYLDDQRELQVDPQINPNDKLNDSRKGLAAYYRYKPRNVLEIYSEPSYKLSVIDDARRIWRLLRHQKNPHREILADLHPSVSRDVPPTPDATIHSSVFERILHGPDRYAPVVVPAHYKCTDDAGSTVKRAYQPPDEGDARSHVQDDVWNWIWLRRVVYFLTVFATLFVAFIPFFVIYAPEFGLDTVGSFVNPLVNAAASFLPGFLDPWFVAFRDAPGFVLIGAAAIPILMYWGAKLQQKIRDVARIAWHSPEGYPPLKGWRLFVYKLRRRGEYRAAFYVLTHWIFPTAIMWWLFWWLAFGTANTLGLICRPTGHAVDVTEGGNTAEKSVGYSDVFYTKELCHPTGLKVTHGETYRIVLTIPENDPWIDYNIPTDPKGFSMHWRQLAGIPFRRLIWSNWFMPIVRVGSTGLEEHLSAFERSPDDKKVWTAEFKARSDGEVFVYVNDTSIFFPWLFQLFYENNQGSAWVALKKL